MTMKKYMGSCLCGYIPYSAKGEPSFPHLCFCHMCQKWSGAPTVAWVEFSINDIRWDGVGGEPAFYRSSAKTRRGFCLKCGGTLCALDDGYENVSITIASLNDANAIVPDQQYSYQESKPSWWVVNVKHENM
jgi:hypothetical protein